MARTRRRWPWLLPLLVLPAVLLSVSDPLYRRAAAQAPAFPFPACQKVWAHRGWSPAGGENSLQSVRGAFERGAAGVEIDILFDQELQDFVVSHDRPYTLFDGQALRLETVLSRHAGSGFFWLDAKDLHKLSPLAARKATKRLAGLIQHYRLGQRALVESGNPLYLSWLASRGVHTSYAISPNDRKYAAPVYRLHAAVTKLGYALAGASAISMDISRYTPVAAATFAKAAVLLSTVNDPDALLRLSGVPQVKVILSDQDHFEVSPCPSRAAP